MQKGDFVQFTTLHHAMNIHLKKYIGLVGRVMWVEGNKVSVTFPPTDFWKQESNFVISLRHLTQRAPDLWDSAPLQSSSTPEADTPAGHLPTPPTSG